MQFETIAEIESFFAQIQHKKRDFPSFFMLKKALSILGDVQNDFQYIQITGTNGKGSTANYLSHFLTSHEINTGLFTSPHIFSITERIKYNNIPIPEAVFVTLFNELYQKVAPTCKLIQFEWLFLLALLYFHKQDIDLIILEVGIGGLFDTTNIIPHKFAAVITNIDYDHQNLLGNSLQKITEQKAGIITDETEFAFLGNLSKSSREFVADKTRILNIPTFYWQTDFNYSITKKRFTIFDYNIKNYDTQLVMYQFENIALALAIAIKTLTKLFKKAIIIDKLEYVIQTLHLPIRFEVISTQKHLHIFDGAHNVSGIKKMLEVLKMNYPNKKYIFVFCAMADKEYQQMLALLQNEGIVVLYDYHQIYNRALTVENIAVNQEFQVLKNQKELTTYLEQESTEIIVYVGSIYFVSYVREFFDK